MTLEHLDACQEDLLRIMGSSITIPQEHAAPTRVSVDDPFLNSEPMTTADPLQEPGSRNKVFRDLLTAARLYTRVQGDPETSTAQLYESRRVFASHTARFRQWNSQPDREGQLPLLTQALFPYLENMLDDGLSVDEAIDQVPSDVKWGEFWTAIHHICESQLRSDTTLLGALILRTATSEAGQSPRSTPNTAEPSASETETAKGIEKLVTDCQIATYWARKLDSPLRHLDAIDKDIASCLWVVTGKLSDHSDQLLISHEQQTLAETYLSAIYRSIDITEATLSGPVSPDDAAVEAVLGRYKLWASGWTRISHAIEAWNAGHRDDGGDPTGPGADEVPATLGSEGQSTEPSTGGVEAEDEGERSDDSGATFVTIVFRDEPTTADR